MKVHLVFAPTVGPSRYGSLGETMWPPLGVLSLASYLRERMPDVQLRVTDGCRIGYAATQREIAVFKPDVLGLSCFTPTALGAQRLARDVKQRNPGTVVVVGGPHATALPDETIRASGADAVVVGEGEAPLAEIIAAVRDKQLIPLRPSPRTIPAADIPTPAYDLIDPSDYRGWFLTRQRPEVAMMSARGCPYWCAFCSIGVWKAARPYLRCRSPESVADELERLEAMGVREVFDMADEFNADVGHALAVCEAIRRRWLRMRWKAQLRVSPVPDELAHAMARAGCWYVHLGIESANQATLDGIGKRTRVADVEPTCQTLNRHGIAIMGLLMTYSAWEDDDGVLQYENTRDSLRTIAFARDLVRRNLLDYTNCSITTPYPGSRLFEIARRHRLIPELLLTDWEAWQREELFALRLPGISRREMYVTKLAGEALRSWCLVRQRQFAWRDVPRMTARAWHLIRPIQMAR